MALHVGLLVFLFYVLEYFDLCVAGSLIILFKCHSDFFWVLLVAVYTVHYFYHDSYACQKHFIVLCCHAYEYSFANMVMLQTENANPIDLQYICIPRPRVIFSLMD